MKKFLSLVLCLLLTLLFVGCSTPDDSGSSSDLPASKPDISSDGSTNITVTYNELSEKYNSLLSTLSKDGKECHYSLKDIDDDGTKELLVVQNTTLTVYTQNTTDNSAIKVGEHDFQTGTARRLYSKKAEFPGIFIFTVGGGQNHYSYLTVLDGKLSIEKLWDENYSNISEVQKVTEHSNNKAKIAESKLVYENNNDIKFSSFVS